MSHTVYRIHKDGQGSGGFLCPPGHPNHQYVVHGYYPRGNGVPNPARRREADLIAGLDLLVTNEYGDVPGDLQRRAAEILANAPLVCSEAWMRNVYGYFRNSYAPADGSRNVADAVRSGPPERHLGYLMVREFFPEHQPRTDLIEDAGKGYGAYPCTKCGTKVQYEARKDSWCQVISGQRWRYIADCPQGGKHEV